MRSIIAIAVLVATIARGADILTWDTNYIGSPVDIYTAQHIGKSAGTSYTFASSVPRGTILLAIGQGTTVSTTNTVTLTNVINKTNIITKTNFVTSTNIVTITNYVNVGQGPGKPPKK